jgi:hypothetical protein
MAGFSGTYYEQNSKMIVLKLLFKGEIKSDFLHKHFKITDWNDKTFPQQSPCAPLSRVIDY